METKNEKVLQVIFKDKEIESFKSIIKKCNENRIGFQNRIFDEDESKLIKSINKSFNE